MQNKALYIRYGIVLRCWFEGWVRGCQRRGSCTAKTEKEKKHVSTWDIRKQERCKSLRVLHNLNGTEMLNQRVGKHCESKKINIKTSVTVKQVSETLCLLSLPPSAYPTKFTAELVLFASDKVHKNMVKLYNCLSLKGSSCSSYFCLVGPLYTRSANSKSMHLIVTFSVRVG